MSKLLVRLIVLAVVTPICLEAQTSSPRSYRLRIEDVMSFTEQSETGISKMTPSQRAAFEGWLSRYTEMVLEIGSKRSEPRVGPASPALPPPSTGRSSLTYVGVGGGHWIDTNGDGKIITLEDGSMWQINPTDQIDTALWLPITDITVLQASSPIGEYRYLLINKEDGEKALAKYLGKE